MVNRSVFGEAASSGMATGTPMALQPEIGSVEGLLQEAEPVIRGAIRHKLRVTLSDTDFRERNLDAQDVLSEAKIKLVRRLSATPTQIPIADLHAYAATAAYHCCADYLRAKYPERTTLKNCLRRLMEKVTEFAVWESSEGDLLCGFSGWRHQPYHTTNQNRISSVLQSPDAILAALPLKHPSAFSVADWKGLVTAVIERIGAPLLLDDLVSIVSSRLGIKDVLDDSFPEDDTGGPGAIHSPDPSPFSTRLAVERLSLLWEAIGELLPWHRTAYLLNLTDGDLEAFPYYGVASIRHIGDSLVLKPADFELLWNELQLPPEARDQVRTASSAEKFATLWKYLPLDDNQIARLLGVTRAQVIGYRSKAMERLRRHLKHLK